MPTTITVPCKHKHKGSPWHKEFMVKQGVYRKRRSAAATLAGSAACQDAMLCQGTHRCTP